MNTHEHLYELFEGMRKVRKETAPAENKLAALVNKMKQEMAVVEKSTEDSKAMQLLYDVAAAYQREDKVVPIADIVDRIKNRKPLKQVFTGFKDFDAIVGSFYAQQLITISAAPKSGKTSFCLELTDRLRALHPLWFPFEESAEELVQKFLDRNEDLPPFFTPSAMAGDTLFWIEQKIVEAIAKYDTRLVFIDHLGFIVPPGSENLADRITVVMRGLKTLAKRWGIILFIMAHTKKFHTDAPPALSDIKDSSGPAQESDTVIMLWREVKKQNGQPVMTNNVNVSVQANRRWSKTGVVPMVFSQGHFHEGDWQHTEKSNETEDIEDVINWDNSKS